MPIQGASSFVPTSQAFLSHWAEVDAHFGEDGALVLAGSLLGTATPLTRAAFSALYEQLLAQRTAVTDALVELDFARADLAALKGRLVARIGELSQRIHGQLPGSKFERALPALPDTDSTQSTLAEAAGRLRRVWQALNAAPATGLPQPLLLRDGFTLAAFTADVSALAPAYLRLAEEAGAVKLEREERNDLQDKIYAVLKAYRRVMPTMVPPGHALAASLPALSPAPGGTPEPVALTGTWEAASQQALLTWGASAEATLDHYEVRAVPGPDYDGEDETVVAAVARDAPRELRTAQFLAAAGSQASFKVYVVLATGNEAGSAAVSVTRPG